MINGFLKKNNAVVNSKLSFRFAPWLIFFFSALIAIPVFTLLDLVLIAKCIGILTSVILAVLIRFWLHRLRLRNKPVQRIVLNQNDQFEILRMMPSFGTFTASEKKDLLHRVGMRLAVMDVTDPEDLALGKMTGRNLAIAIGIASCFERRMWVDESMTRFHFILSNRPGFHPSEAGLMVNLEEVLGLLKGVSKEQFLSEGNV